MDLIIIMLNGTSHTLRVNQQDTVGSLKKLIQDKLGVPSERQKLVFVNGHKTPLNNDSESVSSYGLQSGSQVSLLVTQPPAQPATIQVFLKNLNGQMSTYDIKPDETVSNFKTKVACREGVEVSQQRLLHQSREMTTGRLSDYNIASLSTIHMVLRLRGG